MELKIGHKVFNITENDIVFFNENSNSIELTTQTYLVKFYRVNPKLSKTLFKKLIKYDALYLVKQAGGSYWYKFDIVKLQKLINEIEDK